MSAEADSNVLLLSVDGMDQAKFAVPRDPQLRCSSALASAIRPRMMVHACHAHGYILNIRVADETLRHDSSFVLDLVSETLEKVQELNLNYYECILKLSLIRTSMFELQIAHRLSKGHAVSFARCSKYVWIANNVCQSSWCLLRHGIVRVQFSRIQS